MVTNSRSISDFGKGVVDGGSGRYFRAAGSAESRKAKLAGLSAIAQGLDPDALTPPPHRPGEAEAASASASLAAAAAAADDEEDDPPHRVSRSLGDIQL